jgi:hypothetical protein
MKTIEEIERWVSTRKEAGRQIDIQTCDIVARWTYEADPYGLLMAKGELSEPMQQMGRTRFVMSPDSDGWINEEDLPVEKVKELYARLQCEHAAWKGSRH